MHHMTPVGEKGSMMANKWDTWTITLAGGVMGLFMSIGHIIADRSSAVDVGPAAIGYVVLYIVGAAGFFALVSLSRNWWVHRAHS
jgi:hypothetical protein